MPDLDGGVLLIGAGGLGCAVGLALARLPIPRLVIADDDRIALSNLHRQILFTTQNLSAFKADTIAARLRATLANRTITPLFIRLDTPEAIAELACQLTVTLDASDNFITRFAANDAAIRAGFPLVHGAAIGFSGQLITLDPGKSACLRCLFGGPPVAEAPTCQNEGVLGPLVGEVGWLMALEAVKLLYRTGRPLWNRLLTIDALNGKRRVVPLKPNVHCSCQLQPGSDTP
ncbi:MAG: HesA/MoeB/ThiF family protein [Magnetococcus sp. YQC-9]